MEPVPNCSDVCGSTDCSFDPGINTEEGWKVLQKLCKIAIVSAFVLDVYLRIATWDLRLDTVQSTAFYLVGGEQEMMLQHIPFKMRGLLN